MNCLELLRITSAIVVALLGTVTVRAMFASMPLPYQIEELTLVSLDNGLAAEIGEHLRGASSPQQDRDVVMDIIQNEANYSGIDLQDLLWGDTDEDWFNTEGEHRRLAETEYTLDITIPENTNTGNEEESRGSIVGTKLVPTLVVVVAGLVIVCAILLCVLDVRDRQQFQDETSEKEEESEPEQMLPEMSPSATSSFAQSSYICALAAAQSVLPPVDFVAEEAELASPVSSMTASLVTERTVGPNCDADVEAPTPSVDAEAPTNPVTGSQVVVDADVASPQRKKSNRSGGSVPLQSVFSLSPDRSGISTLTGLSSLTERTLNSENDSLANSLQHEPTSRHDPNQEPKAGEAEASKAAPGVIVEELEDREDSEEERSQAKDEEFRDGDNNQDEAKHEAAFKGENAETPDSKQGADGAEIPVVASKGVTTPATKERIRDIMVVVNDETLGLATHSTANETFPVITHVADDSPLAGQVFEGDVILSVSSSMASDGGHGGDCCDLLSAGVNLNSSSKEPLRGGAPPPPPRCTTVQLTVLSARDDDSSSTTSTTQVEDPLEPYDHTTIEV